MEKRMTKLKFSEARILVYIHQVEPPLKYPREIGTKLNISQAYLSELLQGMVSKKWLKKSKLLHRKNNKVFYELAFNAPLDEAKERLTHPIKMYIASRKI